MDYKNGLKAYLEEEINVINSLDLNAINEVMNVFEAARKEGRKIFICGNGGSAATAAHFASDFNKGVSESLNMKYNFECLSDNVPMMMAVANDIGYDDIFVVPLRNKMKKGDVVIGISGSGNSENVARAIAYANENGAESIAICGYSGGIIKKIAKHCIHVNVNNMQIVEDVHLILDHLMMFILSNVEAY